MNKLVLLSCLILAPSTVKAADLVVYSPPVLVDGTGVNQPELPDSPYNPPSWGGSYIGINAGWVRADFKHIVRQYLLGKMGNTLYDETVSDKARSNHFLGGVQAGYNWQLTERIIAGLEADFQLTNLKGTTHYAIDDYPRTAFDVTSKIDWFGTVRARMGYTPVERLMVYATGGLAFGKVKSSVTRTGRNDFLGYDGASLSKVNTGWTAGGGAEYLINEKWNLKLEYLYVDLGKNSIYSEEIPYDQGIMIDRKVNLQTIRVGINYKF